MAQQPDMQDRRVCIGAIAGPHGVEGLVRVRSYTADPEDVAAYGPLTDAVGRRHFRIEIAGASRDMLLARVEGVRDRNAADALRGVELYIERARLPAPEADEFYHADLIGLPARAPDGREVGTVVALYDYGAGDIIEIRSAVGSIDLLPFTKAVVPEVDLERGFVVIDPPSEIYAHPEDERPEDESVEAGR